MKSPTKFNARSVSILLDSWKNISSSILVSKDCTVDSRYVSGLSKLGILSLCIDKDDTFYVSLINYDDSQFQKDINIINTGINKVRRMEE